MLIRSGSTAAVGAEQIEGIDSRQVLVLQDGLPIIGARGIKSGIVNLNRQDVGRLDRIEGEKGASSALYGSDAMGGVINMITREPSDPLQFGMSLSGGSLGSVDGRIDLGSRWKKLTFFTDLESHRQDAYSLIPGDRTSVGPNFERNDILTKLRYALTDRPAIGFSATAYHHQTGLNDSTLALTLGTSNDSTQSYALTGDFILTRSTTLEVRAYTSRYDENSRTNYADSSAAAFGFAKLERALPSARRNYFAANRRLAAFARRCRMGTGSVSRSKPPGRRQRQPASHHKRCLARGSLAAFRPADSHPGRPPAASFTLRQPSGSEGGCGLPVDRSRGLARFLR